MATTNVLDEKTPSVFWRSKIGEKIEAKFVSRVSGI